MPYFTFAGRQVYYEDHGHGSPLLLLNGVFMSTASWQPLVPVFSRHNRLLLLDFLDQGKSDKMACAYGQELQVDVALALLDYLGLVAAHVVGISYGGQVALRLALTRGDRVTKLVLANTTARVDAWLSDVGGGWAQALGSGDVSAFFRAAMPRIYSRQFYKQNFAWLRRREQVFASNFSPVVATAFMQLLASAENVDLICRLQEVVVETLIVSAEQDEVTPYQMQVEMLSHLPRALHIVIPDCGHASMYEKPREFALAVLGFINNQLEITVGGG